MHECIDPKDIRVPIKVTITHRKVGCPKKA